MTDLKNITDLNEHVSVEFREGVSGQTAAHVKTVTVLRDHMLNLQKRKLLFKSSQNVDVNQVNDHAAKICCLKRVHCIQFFSTFHINHALSPTILTLCSIQMHMCVRVGSA